jgi:hypothetical protein
MSEVGTDVRIARSRRQNGLPPRGQPRQAHGAESIRRHCLDLSRHALYPEPLVNTAALHVEISEGGPQ